MFRPAFYRPYNKPSGPSSPAGLGLGNLAPRRRCFKFFQGPNSTNARSPGPSPLTSPVRGADHPDDDAPPTVRLADIFPEAFAAPQRPVTPSPADNPGNAAKPNAMPAAGGDPLRSPLPPRRKYRSPKRLSLDKDHPPPRRRAAPLRQKKQPSFRNKLHDGHDRRMTRARDAFTRLCREAETLMKPAHMTSEDRIFLKQLRNLELDQKLEHDLERYRQRVARAAAESEARRKAHAARDAEAARLWEEQMEEEVLEEQRRKVEAFVRAEDEMKEERFRQVEQEAMRADQERQRAHQAAERRMREAQERLFRQDQARKAQEEERRREEQTRKAMEEEHRRREEYERFLREQKERQEQAERERERRLREQQQKLREEVERARAAKRREEERRRQVEEEIERTRQEAQGRFFTEQRERFFREMRGYDDILREHRERVARAAQEREARARAEEARRAAEEQQRARAEEEARRAAEEEQIRQYFALYEAKWNELRTSNSTPPIDVREMPWPVFGIVTSADQITYAGVKTFLFHPLRPGVEGKTARDKVKAEVLRFHPDKFNTRIVPKIQPPHQAVAQEIAGAVARILTTVMTEEDQQK